MKAQCLSHSNGQRCLQGDGQTQAPSVLWLHLSRIHALSLGEHRNGWHAAWEVARAVNLPVNVSSEMVVPSQGQLSTGEGKGTFLGSLHRDTCKSCQDSRRERATGPSLCKPQTPRRPLTGAPPGTSPPVLTGIPEHLQGSGPSPAPPFPLLGTEAWRCPFFKGLYRRAALTSSTRRK